MQFGVAGARWRPRDNLHMTLGYFGDCSAEQAEALDDALAAKTLPGFELTLQGAGHFGKKEIGSLFVKIAPSLGLTSLHQHCRRAARAARIDMEARVFHPHITLAYMKEGADTLQNFERIAKFEQRMESFKAKLIADRFLLYSSNPKKKGPNL